MATEYVRVKDPNTKAEYTTDREFAKARGLTVLDKPAVYETGHRQGLPLPAKFSESIADKAAKTTTSSKTTTQKEA